jgi:hypothetical protein
VRIALLILLSTVANGPAFGQGAAPRDDRFAGGDGHSCEAAVVLRVDTPAEVVRAENEWLGQRYPDRSKFDQRLLASADKKTWFDIIVLRGFDGAQVEACFDITREHDAYIESVRNGVAH